MYTDAQLTRCGTTNGVRPGACRETLWKQYEEDTVDEVRAKRLPVTLAGSQSWQGCRTHVISLPAAPGEHVPWEFLFILYRAHQDHSPAPTKPQGGLLQLCPCSLANLG